MASSTKMDVTRLNTSELRRRLTMPSAEPSPASAPKDEESDSLAALLVSKPSVSHHTPSPKEPLKPREIMRPAPAPARPPEPKSSGVNMDMFFPETSQVKSSSPGGGDELMQIRSENNDLRELLDEMRHLLQEANDGDVRLKAELEQKNAQLAEMQQMMQQFEEQLAHIQEPPKAKNADELEEWSDELERENNKLSQMRRDLDADRRQMKQDEQDLQKQMRDMEVGMARERTVMARQETELRRLNAEIQQELELMQRGDPALRQQMSLFQRRHQDIVARAGAAPASMQMSHPPAAAEPLDAHPVMHEHEPQSAPSIKPTDSNMFRRLFKK